MAIQNVRSAKPSRATGKPRVVTSETADALSDLLVDIFFAAPIYRRQNPEADGSVDDLMTGRFFVGSRIHLATRRRADLGYGSVALDDLPTAR